MSYIKYSNQLFLGQQELNRSWRFIVDEGIKRNLLQQTYSYGVVRQVNDTTLNSFRVEAGTNTATIRVPVDSYAINAAGNTIFQKAIDNIAITDDSQWYYVIVSHKFSPIEEGRVSIDTVGGLTGVGTKFTEVLRGQPNFPARIKFISAAQNIYEYDVVEVIDDNNAVLSGSFANENDLEYAVFGTFTPGYSPSTTEKFPFQYDSCDIRIELDFGVPPIVVPGMEFTIARVRSVAGIVEIEDYRSEFWQTRAEFYSTMLSKVDNPLIGVESIKFDNAQSTKEKNIIRLAWGFRSNTYTYDTSLRKITINAGSGGRFKSTADFTTGDFDGWLVYEKKGVWRRIVASTKTGSDINLFLDILNPNDTYTGEEIVVVPDVEEIEFKFGPNGLAASPIQQLQKQVSRPIADLYLDEWLLVPVNGGQTYLYNIQWRYKRNNEYSEWKLLPSDTVGFYDESSFDTNGELKAATIDRNQVPYTTPTILTSGYIQLTANPDNYLSFQNSVVTGDLFGTTNIIINNGSPINTFTVGTSTVIQQITGTITLSADHIYNLDVANAQDGNEFTFIFDANVSPFEHYISINTGYVNPGNVGTVLYRLTPTDLDYMKMPRKQFVFTCRFTQGQWIGWAVERDTCRIGHIEMFGLEVDLTPNINFDNTGKGVSDEYLGWALCNGQNGTIDLRERFIAGSNYGVARDGNYGTVASSEYDNISEQHGSSSYKLTAAQSGVPSHGHTMSHTLTLPNHTHPLSFRQAHAVPAGQGYNDGVDPLGHYQSNADHGVPNSGNPNSLPAINGSISANNSTAQDAAIEHENRPAFTVLGFMQRIPYTSGAGGIGGSVTYPLQP